jgi:hypothetical protein
MGRIRRVHERLRCGQRDMSLKKKLVTRLVENLDPKLS